MTLLYTEEDYFRSVKSNSQKLPAELYRSEFRRDHARLIHSASFRRLQGKMQLFPGAEGDYFRNRLTHSLEVAQIAKSIAIKLNHDQKDGIFAKDPICTDLVEFAALAHDLGHPPFGHEGEDELDNCMRNYGGFEGNAQTLRILSKIEKKILIRENIPPMYEGKDNRAGLNLTYRALAATIKYDKIIPVSRNNRDHPTKGYYTSEGSLVKKIKRHVGNYSAKQDSAFKTIECQIMDIADDIAYSTYDLDDALKSGLVHVFDVVALEDDIIVEITRKANASLEKRSNVGQKEAKVTDVEVSSTLFDVFNSQKLFSPITSPDFGNKNPSEMAVTIGAMYKSANHIGASAYERNALTSYLVGEFIREVKILPNANHPAFSTVYMERPFWLKVEVLKHLAFQFLINTPRWKIVASRAREIIRRIFEKLTDKNGHELLPDDFKLLHQGCNEDLDRYRVICDYIACMTDTYAVDLYARLQSETPKSIFRPF